MNVNRDVLDRLGLRYFVTGSVALAAYAEPRQTRGMDVVVDLDPAAYESRLRLHHEMYRLAFRQVWAQADRAGPMEPLALTRFLLERLYPELRGARLDAIMVQFARLQAEGRWSGPVRPAQDDPE